jgi:hypothetical protein
MGACTEGSSCGQVTIEQAQSTDVGDYLLETPSLSVSVSLSLARARSPSLFLCSSVHMQMSTWDMTLEQEASQLPQAQGSQIFQNLNARRRRRSEDRVKTMSVSV